VRWFRRRPRDTASTTPAAPVEVEASKEKRPPSIRVSAQEAARNPLLAELKDAMSDLRSEINRSRPGDRWVAAARRELADLEQQVLAERANVTAAKASNRAFKALITEFKKTAGGDGTAPGLRSHREGDAGVCYLCGGWTDASSNGGYNKAGFLNLGPLYPTTEHVVPSSQGGRDGDTGTAHMVCNARKGTKALEALSLPFPHPDGYDEVTVLANRARYRQLNAIYDRILADHRVWNICGDDQLVEERRLMHEHRQTLI